MNNFDTKQKSMEYLFYCMPPNTKQDLESKRLTNFGQNTSSFRKNSTTIYLTTTPSKSFCIIFVDIFADIIDT